LICGDRGVAGIFTERDVLKMMAAGADFNVAIDQVMTPDPTVLRAHDTVGTAIAAMTRGGYRRLPIVDGSGRPIGILKVEGILHYLAEHFPTVIYNLPPEPHYSTREREGA
jgi:CBS domain-containing protein